MVYRSLWVANVIYVEGELAQLEYLAEHELVDYITPVPTLSLPSVTDLRDATPTWGVEYVQAPEVWDLGYRGQNITVGGQDTGYDWQHPALRGKYRGDDEDHDYHWHDAIHTPIRTNVTNPCGYGTTEPCDDGAHGTHTMGTAVGSTPTEAIGVAPDADWIGCRNMDQGFGTPYTYIECFEWFVAPTRLDGSDPDPARAPDVLINSWACPEVEGCTPELNELMEQVVSNVQAAGIMVVVSAGNNGPSCSSVQYPPSIFEASYAVGAHNSDGSIAGFSSRGPSLFYPTPILKPDIAAPGVAVRSSVTGGGYASFSGTSMAGPHVSGVVALMLSANPALRGKPERIADILNATATPRPSSQDCGDYIGSTVPNAVYGYGYVDALAAVQRSLDLLPIYDEATAIAVFPNPASEALYVHVDGTGEARVMFSLYDRVGRLVLSQSGTVVGRDRMRVALPGLIPGLYVYRVQYGDRVLTGKVVVE